MLLLAIGVLIGQQMQRSKFDKYLKPTAATEMRLSLLEANLDVIRGASAWNDGLRLPEIYYVPACSCFWASTVVSAGLMNEPLDKARSVLMDNVITARVALKSTFPELSEWHYGGHDPDFRMRFRQLKGSNYEVVAEYEDGKIVFK